MPMHTVMFAYRLAKSYQISTEVVYWIETLPICNFLLFWGNLHISHWNLYMRHDFLWKTQTIFVTRSKTTWDHYVQSCLLLPYSSTWLFPFIYTLYVLYFLFSTGKCGHVFCFKYRKYKKMQRVERTYLTFS